MNQPSQGNVYLFFGLVGAGKGTQVELLEKYFASHNQKVAHLAPGNEYRARLSEDSHFSRKTKEVLNKGLLMPDLITNTLMTDFFLEKYEGHEQLFFDGYPRTINQAQAFLDLTEFFEWPKPTIVFLSISEEEAVKRLMSRGRDDDSEEGIRQRFAIYREEVIPAIDYLREKGEVNFIEIDGERSIEDIHEDIKNKLNLQ